MTIIIIQPSIPSYRAPFFERIARIDGVSVSIYASNEDLGVLTECSSHKLGWKRLGPVRRLGFGFFWQMNALKVPIERNDIVVIWGTIRALSSVALLIKCRMRGADAVWWGHYRSSTSRGWTVFLRSILIKASNYVLFYTDTEVDEFLKAHPKHPRDRVFAMNNGLDIEPIVAARAPYVAAERELRLLFVGRVTPDKEIPVLLEAMAQPNCASVKLDVIGGGCSVKRLQVMSQEFGVADRVTWHGGTTDEKTIAAVANRSRAFVYPGPIGLSLIHAFSYGLPSVVHSDNRGHGPEIAAFKEGENGLSFERGSAQSLSCTIERLVFDLEQLERMSRFAIMTTATSHNVGSMCERFETMVATISASQRSCGNE